MPRRRPTAQPAAAVRAARFGTGDRVRHRRFGDGEVVGIEGRSVEVVFPRAGAKTVDAGYLEKAG